MEKEWPALEECAQYKYGLLHPYLQTFSFESETYADDPFYDDVDDDDEKEKKQQEVLRFLQQVRESRGYDVDINLSITMGSPFRAVDMEIEFQDKLYYEEVMEATQFAIDTINDETKAQTGRTYKVKELKKVVDTLNMMLLLTFTITPEDSTDMDADEKTIQAMVYTSPTCKRINFSLEDWRVKPGL